MRAEFDGQDYLFYVSRDELLRLPEQSLESQLQQPFSNAKLNKRAVLKSGENNGPDGIKLRTLSEEAEKWDKFKEINVTINKRAQDYIQQTGSFGTRYNGSDKIEIILASDSFKFG